MKSILVVVLITLLTLVNTPLAAQDETPAAAPKPKTAAAQPSYRWFEVDYGIHYSGSEEFREQSKLGYRASTNVLLAQHFYFLGSFDVQEYDSAIDFVGTPLTLTSDNDLFNAGFGGYVPFGASTHGIAQIAYEKLKNKSAITDGTDTVRLKSDTDGVGLLLGFRTMLTRRSEFALSYKRVKFEDTQDGFQYEDTVDTFAAFLSAPLSRVLDLTFRFENSEIKSKTKDQATQQTETGKFDQESFLFGVRFIF